MISRVFRRGVGIVGTSSRVLGLALAVTLITGCSSGGDDGAARPAEPVIAYKGKITPAPVTVANAGRIFAGVWDGASDSAVAGGGVQKTSPSNADSWASLAHRLVVVAKDLHSGSGVSLAQGIAVDNTINGSVSGTLRVSGDVNADLIGRVTASFVNFNDGDGVTLDGTMVMEINGYDLASDLITDMTVTMSFLRAREEDSDLSLRGSMRLQSVMASQSETLTVNIDGLDNLAQETFRLQDVVLVTTYDNLLAPSTRSDTETGRVYLEAEGYVDVSTLAPLRYASHTQEFPNEGGPLRFVGVNQSRADVTPLSTNYVLISVDADGDGPDAAVGKEYSWTNLSGEPIPNDPPSVGAVIIAPANATALDSLSVVVDSATDPDQDVLTFSYAWSVNGQPLQGQTGQTLSSGLFDAGDTVEVTVSVSDGINTVTYTATAVIASPVIPVLPKVAA